MNRIRKQVDKLIQTVILLVTPTGATTTSSLLRAANTTVFIHSVLTNKLSLALKVTDNAIINKLLFRKKVYRVYVYNVYIYVYDISGGVANMFYQSCAQIILCMNSCKIILKCHQRDSVSFCWGILMADAWKGVILQN
jgi:hypothetical protein